MKTQNDKDDKKQARGYVFTKNDTLGMLRKVFREMLKAGLTINIENVPGVGMQITLPGVVMETSGETTRFIAPEPPAPELPVVTGAVGLAVDAKRPAAPSPQPVTTANVAG